MHTEKMRSIFVHFHRSRAKCLHFVQFLKFFDKFFNYFGDFPINFRRISQLFWADFETFLINVTFFAKNPEPFVANFSLFAQNGHFEKREFLILLTLFPIKQVKNKVRKGNEIVRIELGV